MKYKIGENQNLGNLEVYEAYFQDNQYNLNFFGPIGTTITLFGEKEFTTAAGFLPIIKTDEKPVHIKNLEGFPAQTTGLIFQKMEELATVIEHIISHPQILGNGCLKLNRVTRNCPK